MEYRELKGLAQSQAWAAKMLADVNKKNEAILAMRQKLLDQRAGIGIGDFVLDGDKVLRVAHDWGEDVQLTDDGSFYLGNGYVSHSGGLDLPIPKTRFEATDERRDGNVWFFSEDFSRAHNGYETKASFRVWNLKK